MTSIKTKKNFLVCQQGLQGAEIGTLGVVLWGLFNGELGEYSKNIEPCAHRARTVRQLPQGQGDSSRALLLKCCEGPFLRQAWCVRLVWFGKCKHPVLKTCNAAYGRLLKRSLATVAGTVRVRCTYGVRTVRTPSGF